jgi:tryptophanyl-tRNA synthetase
MQEFLKDFRERRKVYDENPELVEKILEEGTNVAKERARDTMKDVKHAMKIDY